MTLSTHRICLAVHSAKWQDGCFSMETPGNRVRVGERFTFHSMILNWGHYSLFPGDRWQYLEAFLVISRWVVLLTFSG